MEILIAFHWFYCRVVKLERKVNRVNQVRFVPFLNFDLIPSMFLLYLVSENI